MKITIACIVAVAITALTGGGANETLMAYKEKDKAFVHYHAEGYHCVWNEETLEWDGKSPCGEDFTEWESKNACVFDVFKCTISPCPYVHKWENDYEHQYGLYGEGAGEYVCKPKRYRPTRYIEDFFEGKFCAAYKEHSCDVQAKVACKSETIEEDTE